MSLNRLLFSTLTVLIITIIIAPTAMAEGGMAISSADQKCITCHGQNEIKANLPNGETLPLFVNAEELATSVHSGILQCGTCHANYDGFPHTVGKTDTLREFAFAQSQTCQGCHPTAAKAMQVSVHSGGADGLPAAVCTDCHGAHNIQKTNTASFRTASVGTCSACHGNEALMDQYGLSTYVVSSYLKDFHGKTGTLIGLQSPNLPVAEAVCTDCHGVHNIIRSDSPESTVIKANLANTCRQCHPGASDNFTSAWLSHQPPSTKANQMVFLARIFYAIMIPFVVGGLLIHIGLDIGSLLRKRRGA